MNAIPYWLDSPLPIVPHIKDLQAWIMQKENTSPVIPHLESTIHFHKKNQQAPICILYLHGFSASINETRPLADSIAKRLQANIIYQRIARHSLSLAPMEYLNPENWYYSALEGLAIAKKLGEKVIVMSCSTGGTLSLLLSARKQLGKNTASPEIYSQVLIAPNCWPHPKMSSAFFLTKFHTIVESIPTIPVLGHMLTPIKNQKEKNPTRSPHLVYTAQSDEHAYNNTLRIPTNAITPMMHLVKLVWTIRKKQPHRYHIPAHIIASNEDKEVVFPMTNTFFKKYPASYILDIYNDSKDYKKHVLAGDIFSPESTKDIANIIYNNFDDTIKPMSIESKQKKRSNQ